MNLKLWESVRFLFPLRELSVSVKTEKRWTISRIEVRVNARGDILKPRVDDRSEVGLGRFIIAIQLKARLTWNKRGNANLLACSSIMVGWPGRALLIALSSQGGAVNNNSKSGPLSTRSLPQANSGPESVSIRPQETSHFNQHHFGEAENGKIFGK